MHTDKSGTFDVLPDQLFKKNVDHAVGCLLRPFEGSAKLSRLAIMKVLREWDFLSVVNQIRSAQRSLLGVKCLLKDHTVNFP